ncbi:MAG: hypothetical protein E7478_01420 [Ruminococcaceae bacterium]|nr:hypothetical protein [Oscillospiraceae bacterium]
MGIVGKIVTTVATKSIIKTVGEVTLNTACGIMESSEKNNSGHKPAAYNHTVEIKSPNINELIGDHYLKARAAFVACGFLDITYIEKKDLVKGWITKDGEVEEISINGTTQFNKRTKFAPTSPVVIVYHTFKQNAGNVISQNISNDNEAKCYPVLEPCNNELYCTNCGTKNNAAYHFCFKCGKELTK